MCRSKLFWPDQKLNCIHWWESLLDIRRRNKVQQCFAFTHEANFSAHNLNFQTHSKKSHVKIIKMASLPGYLLKSFLLYHRAKVCKHSTEINSPRKSKLDFIQNLSPLCRVSISYLIAFGRHCEISVFQGNHGLD